MVNYFRRFGAPRNFAVPAFVVFMFLIAGQVGYSQTAPSTDAASTFKSKCASCHGADGAGTTLGTRLHAPDLRSSEVQQKTSAALAQIVTSGKNNMPAFGNRLDSEQIQKLVEYVRTFAKATTAPPK